MDEQREARVVLTADTGNYAAQMSTAESQTQRLNQSVVNLIQSIDRLTKSAGRRLEIVSATTTAGIAAATIAAARFESQLSTLQSQAAITGRDVGRVGDPIDRLRRNLPVTTEQVVALATQLSKLGANPANMERLANTFVKLSAATGEDMGTLTSGMIELQRQMGTSSDSTEKFANSLTHLTANMGVSATGVLQFSQSLAPIARAVGMTQNEIMGVSAAFQKSGQDGIYAASAFSKMLSDISRASRYGSTDLAMYANLVGKTTAQFRGMNATDQAVSIFEALNKQGPEAIKTLERMGFDGVRSMRAIQGVVASGDLRKSLGLAEEGFESDSLAKGSREAMNGLSDATQRLRNNLTSLAQTFGQTFLGPLTLATDGMAKMLSIARELLGPITGLIAALTAAGAGATGITGFALSNIGMLSTAAGGLMLLRSSLGAGVAAGRSNRTGVAPGGMYGRSIDSFSRGEGSAFQRRMFGAGMWLGNRMPGAQGINLSGVPGRIAMGAAGMWQGAMGLARASIDPVRWNAVGDLTRRTRYLRENMRDTWRSAFTGQNASFSRALGVAAASTARFGSALVSATAGVTRLGLAAAGAAAGNALGRAGRGAMNMVGGPWGVAAIGGLGIWGAVSDARAEASDFRDRLSASGAPDASVNRYAASLGLAGQAAMSFADTLRQAEKEIPVTDRSRALQVRPEDIAAGSRAGRELVDTNLRGMSASGAAAYMSSNTQFGTPEMIQAAKLDLISLYGPEEAQRIMRDSARGGSLGNIIQKETPTPGTFFGVSDRVRNSVAAAQSTASVTGAQIQSLYGSDEANQYNVVAINQMIDALRKNSEMPNAMNAQLDSLSKMIGTENPIRLSEMQRQGVLYGSTPQARTDAFLAAISNDQAGRNLAGLNVADPYARDWTAPDSVARSSVSGRIGRTSAGSFAQFNSQIQAALAEEADANLNLTAATGFAQAMTQAKGSTEGAIASLQSLKAAIGDPTDKLYQLAAAAQEAALRVQNHQRAMMDPGQRSGAMVTDLRSAYGSDPGAPDYMERRIGAENAFYAQEEQVKSQLVTMARAFREFDISQSRASEDFAISRARSDYNYYLQRRYSEEDFYLSRQRSDQDYYRNLERSDYDYWLQREYSQLDFNLSRERAEEDYQHQIVMMARQTAKQLSDIYQQVTVQPTWSADNLLVNAGDQLTRMTQQQQDLSTLRGMGVSGDVIEMLGLNQFANQQQLARFVADLAQDPSLVQAWNDAIKSRISIADAFATDEDSDAWKEIQRSFNLTASRAAEDFSTMVSRGAEAYQLGIGRMADDYTLMTQRGENDYQRMVKRQNDAYALSVDQTTEDWRKQMRRAQEDLNRSFEYTTGTFEDLSKQVMERLTGTSNKQMQKLLNDLSAARELIRKESEGAVVDIDNSLSKLYGDSGGRGSGSRSTSGYFGNGGGSRMAFGGGEGGDAMTETYERLLSGESAGGTFSNPVMGKYSMSSPFGYRMHPTLGRRMLHTGQDMAAPTGTGVAAAMPGVVTSAGLGGTYGNLIKIAHGNGQATWYAHLSQIGVREGDTVSAGQRIGAVGSTGRSTGPHLHFELRQNGKAVDPAPFLAGAGAGYNPMDINAIAMAIAKSKHMTRIENTLDTNTPGLADYPKGMVTLGVIDSISQWASSQTMDWYGKGSIFKGPRKIGVGEAGPEVVLPLNEQGAEFMAAALAKFSTPSGAESLALSGRPPVETRSVTYNQVYDHHQEIKSVTVVSNDPNEMFNKLAQKQRMDRLVRPK